MVGSHDLLPVERAFHNRVRFRFVGHSAAPSHSGGLGASAPPKPNQLPGWAYVAATVVVVMVVVLAFLFASGFFNPPPPSRFTGDIAYEGQVTAFASEATITGPSYGRFQVSMNSFVPVDCRITLDNASAHDGTCRSFVYVYKTKRSAEFSSKVWVKASFHRNETDASIKVTLSGEFNWQFSLSGFTETSRDFRSVATQLELAASSSLSFEKLEYRDNLTPLAARNYSVNASEGVWINLTASAEIKVRIEEETTTVVVGDCRKVWIFSWVRQSISVKTKFEIKLTYETANTTSRASFVLTVEGPGVGS